jgi:hypothetical protein
MIHAATPPPRTTVTISDHHGEKVLVLVRRFPFLTMSTSASFEAKW